MKAIQSVFLITALIFSMTGKAQNMPSDLDSILKKDDAVRLASLVNKNNVNECYGIYSLLSQTIRYNAPKCFDTLLSFKADVNRVCNGYVPPLMHAAKYGRMEMVKKLVAKGADRSYVYEGEYEPANGLNALQYAEKYNQTPIVNYLKGL